MARKLPIIECFGPTIQGEGAVAGQMSHFVRFGGCPRKCAWCDSMHAVLAEEVKKNAVWATSQEVAKSVMQLGPSPWVTFSGGDPVMWDLNELVSLLTTKYRIAVETQGDLWSDWVPRVDLLTISPKPPSAQQGIGAKDGPPNYEMIQHYIDLMGPQRVSLKVVVFDAADLTFAIEVHQRFRGVPFYISTGTTHPFEGTTDELVLEVARRYQEVCSTVLKFHQEELSDVAILPQLHVVAWPNQKGV